MLDFACGEATPVTTPSQRVINELLLLQTSQSPERIRSDGPEVFIVSQLVNQFVSGAIRPQEDRGAARL